MITFPILAALLALPVAAAPLMGQSQSQAEWEIVPNARGVDPRLVGAWDLWTPGAMSYRTEGEYVYQRYNHGASADRITIGADGSYQWQKKRGKVVEVRPWYARDGVRYYLAEGDLGKYFLALDDASGNVSLMFTVGGMAAKGIRVGGSPAPDPRNGRKAGQAAGADSAGGSARQGTRKAPQSAPDAPPASGDKTPANPLGVVWAQDAKAAPAAGSQAGGEKTSSNPLGVVWAQDAKSAPAAGAAATGGGKPPANPLGVVWAQDAKAAQESRPKPGENTRKSTKK